MDSQHHLLANRQLRGLGSDLDRSRLLRLCWASNKSAFFHSQELRSHFGCVNALTFSQDGLFMCSGGDDKRLLVWDVSKTLHSTHYRPHIMQGRHESNVFCLDFDFVTSSRLFSGGNDERVLVHDVLTGKIIDVFPHDEPVYCLSTHPECPDIFATACSDGRIQLFDMRKSSESTILAFSSGSFHGVCFNPSEPRLFISANQKDGVSLFDIRKPCKSVLNYGKSRSAMCAKFNKDGTKIMSLGRRLPPVIYDLHSPLIKAQFDHPGYFNSCTMKSGCFGGPDNDLILSGSDDFNLYAWKIPDDNNFCDSKISCQKAHDLSNNGKVFCEKAGNSKIFCKKAQENSTILCENAADSKFFCEKAGGVTNNVVEKAEFVLKGHRSIVNQVRYNETFSILASSGVEKVIKLWSPLNLPATSNKSEESEEESSRRIHSRNDYYWMLTLSDSLISNDYNRESTEENSRMIAFFDSLVQRDVTSSSSSSDSDSKDSDETASVHSDSEHYRDRIDTLIAKKRSICRDRMQKKMAKKSRKMGVKISDDDLGEAVEHAKKMVRISSTETEDTEDDTVVPDNLKVLPSTSNSEDIHREIVIALQQQDEAVESDKEQAASSSRTTQFKKGSGAKGKSYRKREQQ